MGDGQPSVPHRYHFRRKGFIIMETAILLQDSIRANGSYQKDRLYPNGVILAYNRNKWIAIHQDVVAGLTLRPVLGRHHRGQGWIFPNDEPEKIGLQNWKRELACIGRLEWLRRLGIKPNPADAKIAIEDFSATDLTLCIQQGWYVGRSLHAPLWRIYALVPQAVHERPGFLKRFDGRVRVLTRFGAIYDPKRHQLQFHLTDA